MLFFSFLSLFLSVGFCFSKTSFHMRCFVSAFLNIILVLYGLMLFFYIIILNFCFYFGVCVCVFFFSSEFENVHKTVFYRSIIPSKYTGNNEAKKATAFSAPKWRKWKELCCVCALNLTLLYHFNSMRALKDVCCAYRVALSAKQLGNLTHRAKRWLWVAHSSTPIVIEW